MRHLLSLLIIAACADLELHADLDPPTVVSSSLTGPRTVELPVRAAIDVHFSEPVDPASVVVALVRWQDTGNCTLTPGCDDIKSSCERGRCQRDPLTATIIKRVAAGEPPEHASPVEHVLSDSLSVARGHLRISPTRALTPHARHSLLVSVRDDSGAAIVEVWRRDLVTAGEGSSGPEARLVSPPDGAALVPPNIAHVDTEFVRPVALDPAATLELSSAGHRATLVDPSPCPGWVPGLCVRWRLAAPLRPGARYEPAGGSLRDLLGRPALAGSALGDAAPRGFTTAAAPDTTPPIVTAELSVRGPCLYADLVADEPLALDLTVDDHHDLAITGGGAVRLALHLADLAANPGAEISGRLIATDLADNRSELAFTATVDASWAADRTPLGLAEILANPLGAEPRQEFVELADPRSDGPPAMWPDLHLADLPWPDVAAALAAGEDPPGDPLPVFAVAPGARVVIVAAGFDPDAGDDPPPAPGTALLRVDASLGAGGLKNAGEPLTLYAWSGGDPALIASYGDHVAQGAGDHAGRSVVADPAACDLPRAWRSHPHGTSTPGAAP